MKITGTLFLVLCAVSYPETTVSAFVVPGNENKLYRMSPVTTTSALPPWSSWFSPFQTKKEKDNDSKTTSKGRPFVTMDKERRKVRTYVDKRNILFLPS